MRIQGNNTRAELNTVSDHLRRKSNQTTAWDGDRYRLRGAGQIDATKLECGEGRNQVWQALSCPHTDYTQSTSRSSRARSVNRGG